MIHNKLGPFEYSQVGDVSVFTICGIMVYVRVGKRIKLFHNPWSKK